MPATTDYLPSREADLLQWSVNFNARINASPMNYGLSVAQAAAYTTLHDAFAAAYTAANEPITRTAATIATKNSAKEALIRGAGGIRELAGIVQAFPGTTDTERIELGLTVRDTEPTPVPPPATAPTLSVISTLARVVKVRLRDAENPDRRGKPTGVSGAALFTFVGETPPSDPLQWSFLFNTSRTVFDVQFPSTVAGGSKVWLTAFWFNPRKESGPASAAVSTRIDDGMSAAA